MRIAAVGEPGYRRINSLKWTRFSRSGDRGSRLARRQKAPLNQFDCQVPQAYALLLDACLDGQLGTWPELSRRRASSGLLGEHMDSTFRAILLPSLCMGTAMTVALNAGIRQASVAAMGCVANHMAVAYGPFLVGSSGFTHASVAGFGARGDGEEFQPVCH